MNLAYFFILLFNFYIFISVLLPVLCLLLLFRNRALGDRINITILIKGEEYGQKWHDWGGILLGTFLLVHLGCSFAEVYFGVNCYIISLTIEIKIYNKHQN